MTKENDKKINRMGSMKALEIGESVAFPLDALFSVRSVASDINATRGTKSLKTKIDREAGIITITRIQ